MDESAYRPAVHDATQLLPCKSGVLVAHAIQSSASPPLQLEQLAWHGRHLLLPSCHVPTGHVGLQSPSSVRMGADELHDVQFVLVPKQVAHVALQLAHCTIANCTMANRSSAGESGRYSPGAHAALHVPCCGSKIVPRWQDVQLESEPPRHVAHETSHAKHTPLALGYVPSGHSATHLPVSPRR